MSIIENLGNALEWAGFDADTAEGVITVWRSAEPQPSGVELDQIVSNYEAALPTLRANRDIDGLKILKAVIIWLAPLVGKTPAEARDEIILIYKSL